MKNKIRIRVCPIKQLYTTAKLLDRNVAAVLCTTNPVSKIKLEGIQFCHISFSDITDSKRFDAFKKEKADRIRKFIDGLEDVSELYICCDSGESRSAAIAAAVLRYYGRNEMAVWANVRYHPNPYVYHLQCQAFGLSSSKVRALLLSKYNKYLFKKQIQAKRKT